MRFISAGFAAIAGAILLQWSADADWTLPPDPWVDDSGHLKPWNRPKIARTGQQEVDELVAALDCSQAIGMAALGGCEGEMGDVLDRRLNMVYRALIDAYVEKTAERFKQAERAWIKFRDASCAFEVDPEAEGFYRNACLNRATAARLAVLYDFASQDNGPERK